jgi:hypothetical protein
MKNVYTVFLAICGSLLTLGPQNSCAQCLCSGGVTPNMIIYQDTLLSTDAASSTISFPKFNPSIGTLNCVSFIDTISGVTTTNAWNLASSAEDYSFLLIVDNSITGPGISVDETFTKIYGPDSLQAKGNPGDSITYGPDSLFRNNRDSNNTATTAPYLGSSGNVSYTYTLGGGLNSIGGGGLNYGDQIVTNYWGNFKLIYYWCNASILATEISDFTAARSGESVLVSWQAPNEIQGIRYDIEYSTDGSHFMVSGTELSDSTSSGQQAFYQYNFAISSGQLGQLYFRLKRTAADGKTVIYSAVKTVNLSNSPGMASLHTYPNPVVSYAVVEFDQILNGNFELDLISTTGQIIQHEPVTLSGSNQIRMNLNSKPASGIYYLHVLDKENNLQYITKLVIE